MMETTARISIPDRRYANALKTQCPRGHLYTPENTFWRESDFEGRAPTRICRACYQAKQREYQRQLRAKRREART